MNQEVLYVGFHIWILLNIITAGYSVFLNLREGCDISTLRILIYSNMVFIILVFLVAFGLK